MTTVRFRGGWLGRGPRPSRGLRGFGVKATILLL